MTDFSTLFFPLGYIASLLFFLRFAVQWIQSERKKQSHVTPIFWILSLFANIAMAFHGWLQSQFPIILIQSTNAVISWRNLDMMKKARWKRAHVMMIMATTIMGVSIFFFLYSSHWMRSPNQIELPWIWHLFGFLGMCLFACRFWIQWWNTEREKKSHLSASFWKISLIGGLCSFIYSIRLQDSVQIIGFGLGLLPYIRNLCLLKKKSKALQKGTFFFVAGETSGDLLGKELIEELKKQSPPFTFKGVGGPLMSSVGMEITIPMKALNVMGFSDVILAFPRLLRTFHEIKKAILNICPEKVILIDYQDFNMLLAKRLRKSGYKGEIIHYVSPSVWAWRKKRVFALAKTHNLLISIFPFEKFYYSKTSLRVEYVGHPLVSAIRHTQYEPFWKEKNGLTQNVLSIFPGSRNSEVRRNLALQLSIAKRWLSNHHDFVLAISVAHDDIIPFIDAELKKINLTATLVPFSSRYDLMKATNFAIATSGTVTLELALHQVPTEVVYHLSPLNYFMARYLFRIKLPHYCIVNIIAGKEIFPEFFGKVFSAEVLNLFLEDLFNRRKECQQDLMKVCQLLGINNASHAAACLIASTNVQ